MKRLLLATALTGMTLPVFAAAPQTAAAPTTAPAASTVAAAPVISKQMHDDVMAMLQLTYTPHLNEMTKAVSMMYVNSMQAKYRDISPAVADEIRADIGTIMSDPQHIKSLEENLVPVYASLYSDDEVRQVIAFSKTPGGAKLFSGTPTSAQISAALQPWMLGTIVPAIMVDTAQILKKHGVMINADGN